MRCHQTLRHGCRTIRKKGFSVYSEREASGRICRDEWYMLTHVRRLLVEHLLPLLCPCADNPIDGTDGGDIVLIADAFLQKTVSYLPGKDGGILLFVVLDLRHHIRSGYFRLAPSNHPWLDGTSFIVPGRRINVKCCCICTCMQSPAVQGKSNCKVTNYSSIIIGKVIKGS